MHWALTSISLFKLSCNKRKHQFSHNYDYDDDIDDVGDDNDENGEAMQCRQKVFYEGASGNSKYRLYKVIQCAIVQNIWMLPRSRLMTSKRKKIVMIIDDNPC